MAIDQFKNVFVADGGDLVSKTDYHVVREKYSYTFRDIKNSQQLRATIRNGKTAWPGGYPLFLFFGDGEICCFDCARKDYPIITGAMTDACGPSFKIVGCDVNWEDDSMYCANCNKQIESAYGETNEGE